MSELLSSLNIDVAKDLQQRPEESAWDQFKQSFVYESQQQVKALAQTVGKGDSVEVSLEPQQSETSIGQHAQMFGRAAADVIPIVVTGIAVRAGFGKYLAKAAEPSVLMQRSVVGLNTVESATTGLLTGSLLKPSDTEHTANLASFLEDRTRGGVSGALSFMAFTGFNVGAERIGAKSAAPIRALLANPVGNGMITGAPAGLVNAELDSLIRDGKITTDGAVLGKSMYEMTMIGGAFGAFNSAAKYRNQLIERRDAMNINSSLIGATESLALDESPQSSGEPVTKIDSTPIAIAEHVPRVEVSRSGPDYVTPIDGRSDSVSHPPLERTETKSTDARLVTTHEVSMLKGPSGSGKSGFYHSLMSGLSLSYDLPLHRMRSAAQGPSAISKLFGAPEVESEPAKTSVEKARGTELRETLEESPTGGKKVARSSVDVAAEKQKSDVQASIASLQKIFGADNPDLARLIQNRDSSNFLMKLSDFVEENPERRKASVELEFTAGRLPNTDWLKSFEKLQDEHGVDAQTIRRIKDYPDTYAASEIVMYIESAPESRVPQVQELTKNNAHFLEFNPSLMKSLETIRTHLGADTESMKKMLEYKDQLIDHARQEEKEFELSAKARETEAEYNATANANNPNHKVINLGRIDPEIPYAGSFGASGTISKSLFDTDWYDKVESMIEAHTDARGRPLMNIEAFEEVANFLESRPEQKSVLERELAKGLPANQINESRLKAIGDIENTFGADSPTTAKILALESPDYELESLIPVLDSDPQLVQRLVDSGASPAELKGRRLLSVSAIEQALGESSPTTSKLLSLEREGLDLSGVSNFLKNPGASSEQHAYWNMGDLIGLGHTANTMAAAPASESAARFVEERIKQGAKANELTQNELNARFQLEGKFGVDSPLYIKMLEVAEKNGSGLVPFHNIFADNSLTLRSPELKVRPEVVANLLDVTSDPKQLDATRVKGLQEFLDLSPPKPFDLVKLLKLQDEGLDLHRLSQFVKGVKGDNNIPYIFNTLDEQRVADKINAATKPEALRRAAWVQELMDSGATAEQLDSNRLTGLAKLIKHFGAESPVVQHLLSVEKNDGFMGSLGQFINKGGDEGRALLRRLTVARAPKEQLEPSRMQGFLGLEKVFEPNSHYMNRLLEAESKGASLSDIDAFLANNRVKAQAHIFHDAGRGKKADTDPVAERKSRELLQNILDEPEIDPKKLSSKYLSSRLKLQGYLGEDSPTMKRVLALAEDGLDIRKLREFIDEDHKDHKLMVQSLVDGGATPAELTYSRLRGLSILINRSQLETPSYEHLLKLEKQGLRISDVAEYVQEDAEIRGPQIKSMLDNGCSLQELNVRRLADAAMLAKLTAHFGDDRNTMDALAKLQTSDLSANRLVRFVDDNPASRKDLVLKLLDEHADVARFNQQMSLSGFPDDVAYTLSKTATHEGLAIGPTLGYLRDWKSGSAFREAVIEKVRAGEAGTAEQLKEIYDKVKQQERESQRTVQVEKPASEPEKLEPLSEANGEDPFADFDFDGDARGKDIAKILNDAIKSIDKVIPKDQTIVLLGRDNWPLFPALKAQGRPVQYFLWSRLQDNDQRTGQQWLKEVPPNAAVIDTGYSGTILDYIRRIDPSASGYLLSSSGKYPRLLNSHNHQDLVQSMEYFPKLISRSKTYTEKGGAVSRIGNRDGDEEVAGTRDLNHRWFVQGANVEMLRALKLPEWDIWRFSEYVGLTPKERLGLNTNEELQEHYRQIEQARSQVSGSTKQ